jgi:hypothetical protein
MMMLCDAAQSVGGKLYILGGAWSQLRRPPGVRELGVTVAVKLSVPWDLANHRMDMNVRLLTDQGELVVLPSGPVEATGQMEVGRGLGLRQGTPLLSTFVIPFGIRDLDPGGYVFELQIDGRIVATEPFQLS